MTARTPLYSGVIPPLVSPLATDGSLDVAALERLVAFQLDAGVHGIFALGSSGETVFLTDALRDAALEVIVKTVSGAVPVIAGCIEPTTARVIGRAETARRLGADAVVATPPFYALVGEHEIERHYRLVRAAVDLPLLAYDVPVCTQVKLGADLLTRLALDGVIDGMKDSSGDDVSFRATVLALAGHPTFAALTGHEIVVDAMLLAGADGAVPGLGNVDPHGYVRLHEAATSGRWDDARAEQERLAALFRIVLAADRRTAGGNSAGIGAFKTALALRGIIDGNTVSPPMRPLDAGETSFIATCLGDAGLL